MSAHDDDNDTKTGLWVVGGVVALVVAGVVGYAASSGGNVAATADATSELSSTATLAMADHAEHASEAMSDDAAPMGDAVGQIYFATGKTTVAADQEVSLMAAVSALKDAPTAQAVLSGFHDSTGSLETNQRVAKARAMAVRDALVAQGIEESRIRMEKPSVMLGSTDPQQARRVDILLLQ